METAGHRHRGDGLAERARLKLIEVEGRIAALTVIKQALKQTIEVGCVDLVECAQAGCCPIPFTPLAEPRPGARNPEERA
ncbi:hypothetical protein [Actinocorallia herbida]|uniref:hypothetical protein n=1 Tax=Actinocorallia herbida TaxID=58109 RepID=UPI00248260C6|nr:hypothetical protein [Actinocorallia herbida]